MEKIIVEIRAGEGGNDAKDLVLVQHEVYKKYLIRRNLSHELITYRPGFVVFRVSGKGANSAFASEGGGIRWQRIPPSEKRGRVHTSTVTVVVLPEPKDIDVQISEKDLTWQYFRGKGNGGQKKNKTSSAVRLTHGPTGIKIRVEAERSQLLNREQALSMLRAQLYSREKNAEYQKRWSTRKKQAGSGMRGDKVRTIQCQNGQVTDHVHGWRLPLKKYLRGQF